MPGQTARGVRDGGQRIGTREQLTDYRFSRHRCQTTKIMFVSNFCDALETKRYFHVKRMKQLSHHPNETTSQTLAYHKRCDDVSWSLALYLRHILLHELISFNGIIIAPAAAVLPLTAHAPTPSPPSVIDAFSVRRRRFCILFALRVSGVGATSSGIRVCDRLLGDEEQTTDISRDVRYCEQNSGVWKARSVPFKAFRSLWFVRSRRAPITMLEFSQNVLAPICPLRNLCLKFWRTTEEVVI